MFRTLILLGLLGSLAAGCRSTGGHVPLASATRSAQTVTEPSVAADAAAVTSPNEAPSDDAVPADAEPVRLATAETPLALPPVEATAAVPSGAASLTPEAAGGESTATGDPVTADGESFADSIGGPAPAISLVDVVQSVRSNFPLIQAAAAARTIASGETLSALGAWDHKLEGFSESQPLDFYENYRHQIGLKRDTYWGGQVFTGYRNGRGIFEPWYLERETNKGGEFKLGFVAPFAKDRWIDENRAEFWRAQLEQRRVEPEIEAQVLLFVRDGSAAYWEWVAAGEALEVATEVLQLGLQRRELLAQGFAALDQARQTVEDNNRIIFLREAKQTDARRKLEQAAAKLALFYRDAAGSPFVPTESMRPEELPRPVALTDNAAAQDEALALASRPELIELQLVQQQLGVAYQQATNETLPEIDGGILVGQDIGEPTSSKRDKSELELEARVTLSVPLERRKALGKMRQLTGKLAQVRAKTRFTADKILAEVRVARAALQAAAERAEQTAQSRRLAESVESIERLKFREGESSLFTLNIREQQTVETRLEEINARLDYHTARAAYLAALGVGDAINLAPIDAGPDALMPNSAEPDASEGEPVPAPEPLDAQPLDVQPLEARPLQLP